MQAYKPLIFLVFLIQSILFFKGCQPFFPPPPPPPPVDTKACHLEGILYYHRSNPNQDPAVTYLGVTIKTDDGREISPCNSDLFDISTYPHGSRIKFGYDETACMSMSAESKPLAPQPNLFFITCLELISSPEPEPVCAPLMKMAKGNAAPQPYKIYQDDNCLKMRISYSGCGKRTEDFKLVWDGNMTRSIPPQMKLELIDQLEGPTCMMVVDDELSFDITPILNATNKRPAILHINGLKFELN